MYEHSFYCPHCSAQDSILINPQRPNHNYILDCVVCENPIKIHFDFRIPVRRKQRILEVA